MAESYIHKHLKQVGMYWLKSKVTDLICVEAKYKNLRSVADVAGINLKREEVRIIECKATYQDFKRDTKLLDIEKSYYKHCHYFYILCLENVITIDDIPKEYGLLYLYDNDTIQVIQKPMKYNGRLKTLYKTSLKNIARACTNTLLYYFDNQENKDEMNGKFKRNANIFYSAITCPKCKHVTKELISNKTMQIKCKNCKEMIEINNTKRRDITAFNKTFFDKTDKLRD